MHLMEKVIAVLAVTAVSSSLSWAQANAGNGTGTAASAANVMRLSVFLNGSAAEALQNKDFTLLDNGAPANVQSVQAPGSQKLPTHVILVIDDVNARLTTIAYERSELQKFLKRNGGKLSLPFTVAVMTDTKLEIQPGFSQDGNAVNQGLQKYEIGLHEIRRDAQYGGLDRTNICLQSLRQLVQYAGTIPGHKLILFVSPGWPLLSGPRIDLTAKEQRGIYQTVAQLQDAMLRSDVTLNMLNPFGPNESPLRSDYYQAFLKPAKKPSDTDIADLSLQVLATHAGGEIQQGTNDLNHALESALAEEDHRYSLVFSPNEGDNPNGFHSLKVQVNRPGVTVRTADEYYSQQAITAGDSR